MSKCQSSPGVIRQPIVCSIEFPAGNAYRMRSVDLSGSKVSADGALTIYRTPSTRCWQTCSAQNGLDVKPGKLAAFAIDANDPAARIRRIIEATWKRLCM